MKKRDKVKSVVQGRRYKKNAQLTPGKIVKISRRLTDKRLSKKKVNGIKKRADKFRIN